MPQGAEWFILLAIVLLLFGASRLPATARALGRSVRILRSEARGLNDDEQAAQAHPATDPAASPHPEGPGALPSSSVVLPQAGETTAEGVRRSGFPGDSAGR